MPCERCEEFKWDVYANECLLGGEDDETHRDYLEIKIKALNDSWTLHCLEDHGVPLYGP
jgi:hypothetical protein